MDGGIDLSLSRIVFPNIEKEVRSIVRKMNIQTKLNRPYLPIGSSLIVDYDDHRSLIVAPTMLLPQDVSKTDNAYYATIAILYNILVNRNENMENVDILFTSLCCGYGKMSVDESINQICDGIRDYKKYNPIKVNKNIILCEPNLRDQPKYYQNSEWFDIDVKDIVKV
jgi:O-acetyl-ADP-ribose deacetylase (regulator of RNase III)